MTMTSLADYAAVLQTADHEIPQSLVFSSVSIDTRTLQPGALFIALKGDAFDGHDYIKLAAEKGAVAAIVDQPVDTDLPYITVPNTRQALGLLAQHHRQRFTAPIIALTGSCGKTTTKEYLHRILSQCGHVLAAERSFNNDIGVPLTLLRLDSAHDFVVLEMGANAVGEIAYLTRIATPDIAMILNIAPAHLEGFGSINHIAQAKSEIFQGLSLNGVAIVNETFSNAWGQYLPAQKTVYFGESQTAQVTAQVIGLNEAGCPRFTLSTPIGCIDVQLQLPGQHQIENALAATAASISLNISLQAIKLGLESLTPISGRLVTRFSVTGARILDDTYNANPHSMKAGLSVLSHHTGKRVLVLGDMSELGEASQNYHGQIGQWARQYGIQQVFTCGDQAYWAASAFGPNAAHFRHQNKLISALKQCLNEEYTVLIKGSRAASMEKVVNALTIPAK